MREPTTALFARLDDLLSEIEPAAVEVRRHLHSHPELGWEETETQRFLTDWLRERGLDPRPVAGTGLVVDIGEGDGRLLYRADIDALPMQDAKQPGRAPCTSQRPGVCHACGHDVHTAIAAGLAAGLHALGDDLPVPVRVVFQPAEELLPSGAVAVLEEGVADGVAAGLALHCDPTRDAGTVGLRVGPLTATADAFEIDVIGEAGHNARPHLAHDAILAAATVVQTLHSLVAQRVDPLETAVLGVGRIAGGEAENVVAGKVTMAGALRTLYNDTRLRLHKEIRQRVETAALLHGCTADIRWRLGAPPVVNHEALDAVVSRAASDVLGPAGAQRISVPSTGAEDFGQFSALMPTYMLRLGVRTSGHPTLHLHTPTFDVDERAIGIGMRVMARSLCLI